MPNAHIREIAQFGVIADPDPYDLPITAWSMGVNVRFKNKKVFRSPVYRNVSTSLDNASPRFLATNAPSTGFDTLFIGYLNGAITTYDNGVETDVSIAGYTPSNSEEPYSACFEGDVFYMNRADRVPWYLGPTDTQFATLPNWDSGWRAKLLRAYAGALVALNVTIDGTSFPTRILTSEFATAGNVPSTWDFTDPENNATSNILAELEGPIVDAQTLRNSMFIYGRKATWIMQLNPGSEDVYSYDPVFAQGVINANCVVTVNNQHYVFGPDDIWKHDGNSSVSIIAERNRDFVFNSIDISKAERCFVYHDAKRKEVEFHYVSGDRVIAFDPGNAEGCNRKAVYDYVNDTWTFDDAPFTFFASSSNLDSTLTYETVTATYETIGGSYLDQEDSLKKTTVVVGGASTPDGLTDRLYAFDNQGPGSTVSFAVNTSATKPAYLEREGIDLDEVQADLNGYKTLSSLYPQARLEAGAEPLEFDAGSSDYSNQSIIYKGYQTFDGDSLYKLDYNTAGRYLAIRMRHDDYHWFTLSGFDADVDVVAER